eukprot:CAMPEP_0172541112 /NCGR_PEP_ID=MMETSP1067-20121228/11977_1 /TAXON_ID=265564 ORGANISM="Thalassiosira punctigera, Strain Tpunct2005C2" /NCGR_SAMPLE_ID=MMETSP1067 /ASSEMBLY_ACC=CAM_ASM_000444 /LENGTH=962 /DNA_ID=CAMNT_0013327089 /DNA_START=189 /DNA_END=3077 /DNA_ORIENTATION=+
MRIGHADEQQRRTDSPQGCGGRSRQCDSQRRRDPDRISRLARLAVLLASLYAAATAPAATDALALPGRGIFRRHRAAAGSITSTELGRDRDHDEPLCENHSVRSPAFSSPLFNSQAYRASRDRSSRRNLVITQRRRKLFRREGNFRLNYQDYDDELLSIIENQRLPKRVIGRWRRRKALSRMLFPPVEEEIAVDEDSASHQQSDRIVVGEEALELPVFKPIRRKKRRTKVVVSNVDELHEAILDRGFELRDVELKYAPPPSLLTSKKQLPAETAGQQSAAGSEEVTGVFMADGLHLEYVESQPGNAAAPDIELEDCNKEPNAEEWQLIGNVLAENCPIPENEEDVTAASQPEQQPFSHDVLNLLRRRYQTKSTPMNRAPDDTSKLALSIEGGGMRGAVSGGMAAAVACLGLSNAFDSVYGSSAGSIIGSYFVSRQLYLDVYTDVIPAGKDLFVSKSKIFGDIFRNAFHVMRRVGPLGKKLNANLIERWAKPGTGVNATSSSSVDALPPTRAGGLNISFVLDTIMCPERGLRPLDLEAFAHNDAVQPLRIVSSSVELETGRLKSVCFGSREGHFRDGFGAPEGETADRGPPSTGEDLYPEARSAKADGEGRRRGLWASLGASMLVPGAADSPFRMNLPSSNKAGESTPHLCFDAFCYEPVPFRSAVAEGATHVLALRSRPAGFVPKTKPTLYERAVAPLYFRSNGVPDTVAEFFERGGQQYLYAEDVLTCDKGLDSTEAIPIPPARVLYAGPDDATADADREGWARAHLLPVAVPADVPELSTLSSDRDDILAAMRSGFAAAYDALAPVVGLEAGGGGGPDSLDGTRVAELVFPDVDAPHESVLEKQLLAGEKLGGRAGVAAAEEEEVVRSEGAADAGSSPASHARDTGLRRLLPTGRASRSAEPSNDPAPAEALTPPATTEPPAQHEDTMFSFLPGVQLGTLPMVAERLQTYLESHSYLESA